MSHLKNQFETISTDMNVVKEIQHHKNINNTHQYHWELGTRPEYRSIKHIPTEKHYELGKTLSMAKIKFKNC